MHNCKCDHGCKHKRVKYCEHCGKVYCLDCNSEWGNSWYYYPYQTTYTANDDWTVVSGGTSASTSSIGKQIESCNPTN